MFSKLIRISAPIGPLALALSLWQTPATASTFELDNLFDPDRSQIPPAAAVDATGLTGPLAQKMRRAQRLFLEGQFQAAKTLADDITVQAPAAPAGWHMLGLILANQKEYNQSLDALKTASDLYTANAEPLIVQGDILLLLGRPKDARAAFLQAVARDPDNWRGTEMAAHLAEEAGDRPEAIRLYARAAETAPADRLFPHLRLARLHIEADRAGQAVTVLEAYTRQFPKNLRALAALGHAQLAAARPRDATESFERAIALTPDNAALVLLHGRALLADGQTQAALTSIQTAQRLAPSAPGVYLALGNYHGAVGAYQNALDSYERGLALDGQAAKLLRGARLAAFRLDRPATALGFSQRVARGTAATSDDHYWHGFLLEKERNIAAATNAYETALTLDPRNWVAANNLSVLVLEKDPKRAAELARFAAEVAPHSLEVQATLGWAQYHTGEIKAAQAVYERLTTTEVPKARHLYRLGRILIAAGAQSAGRAKIEAALATDASFDGADEARALLAQ